MKSTAHPDYVEAAKRRQWRGLPECLWQTLTRFLDAQDYEGGWRWRILPNGVVVALRTVGTGDGWRYELRLARRSAGDFRENDLSWEGAIRDVLRAAGHTAGKPAAFDHASWHRTRKITEAGRRVAFYRSLLWGEIKPGVAECWECRRDENKRTETEWRPGVDPRGQLCEEHCHTRPESGDPGARGRVPGAPRGGRDPARPPRAPEGVH